MNKQSHVVFSDWSRGTFLRYRDAVVFIETEDRDGNIGIATGFHVGEGVFLTAEHSLKNRKINTIGIDDGGSIYDDDLGRTTLHVVDGPFFHTDDCVDVACFKAVPAMRSFIPLGGHLDDWLDRDAFLLNRTLILSYPPIPQANRPCIFAQSGEINALVDKYTPGRHPYFAISTMARGGFSGSPVLLAYNELNVEGGTAALGMVTESLCINDAAPESGYLAVLTVEPLFDCLSQANLTPKAQRIFDN